MNDNRVCFAFASNIKRIVNSVKGDFEAVFLEDDGVADAVYIYNGV